ncbi:MAG TPA: hypothetical protein VJY35_09740 [Candidatus Eisenbacteria bacterium]|nr:hypothetical protein [Candidatus Eisenbacteria bacterium]
MRRLILLAVALAALSGPGVRAQGAPPAGGWPPETARDSLVKTDLPAGVWAARDTIARLLAKKKGAKVWRSSGRFESPAGALMTTARLTIHGSYKTTPEPKDAISLIEAYLNRSGWRSDEECSTDGPDGTFWGMRRAGVRCLVRGLWDGGDAMDSTYVPAPEYQVIVDCLVDRVDICPH